MKTNTMSQFRTLLFLGIAAAFGTANAGVLEVGPITHTPDAAGNNQVAFVVANTSATKVSDVHVYLNGQDGAAICAGTTSAGQAFALAGELGAGDSVGCSGAGFGQSTSITVLGKGSNGVPFDYTAHAVRSVAATPTQAQVGILFGAAFNDANSDQQFQANETISLSFTIVNFGNAALSGIVVSDDVGSTISCPQTTLAIGEAMFCNSTHVITAAEAGNGSFGESAYVDAIGPGNQAVNSDDAVSRTGTSAAEIRGLKSPLFAADNDGNTVAGPGDLVAYTFAVKNSGSLILNPVNMIEPDQSRIDGGIITCSGTTVAGNAFTGLGSGTLAVGDTILCSATYTITDADVTAGEADNLATITGLPPAGGVASGSAASALVVPAPPPPPSPVVSTPVNDWRALTLLGLGLLGLGVVTTRRKTQRR